jgi:hypothetical protein
MVKRDPCVYGLKHQKEKRSMEHFAGLPNELTASFAGRTIAPATTAYVMISVAETAAAKHKGPAK